MSHSKEKNPSNRERLNGLARKLQLPPLKYEKFLVHRGGRARHSAKLTVFYNTRLITWCSSERDSGNDAKEDVAEQAYNYILEN